MKELCDCGSKTIIPRPLKYSPSDRLELYRRRAKIKEYIDRGLL